MQAKKLGILLFKKVIKENDLYLKILTEDDQLTTGIVYGGNSSKKKNIYQIGYYLNLILSKKNPNSPYIIKAEITHPYLVSIFDDKYKLYCLLSILSLVNLSIIEGQTINGLFRIINKFINHIIIKKNWIKLYCKWLFQLLKVIGYEIDYKSNSDKKFFNVNLLQFTNEKKDNSFIFPHKWLQGEKKITFTYINETFLIFEYTYLNNHLNNLNYKLPVQYLSFKKLILNYFKKN